MELKELDDNVPEKLRKFYCPSCNKMDIDNTSALLGEAVQCMNCGAIWRPEHKDKYPYDWPYCV